MGRQMVSFQGLKRSADRFGRLVILVLFWGTMFVVHSAAQERREGLAATEPIETRFGAWSRVCVDTAGRGGSNCGLAYAGLPEEAASVIGAGSPLIAVTVQRAGSRLILVLRTKLGLLLPGGVQLQIDRRKPLKAAFRSCHASRKDIGCIVPVPLEGAFLRRVKAGLVLTVSAKTLAGEKMEQRLSLIGVTEAVSGL